MATWWTFSAYFLFKYCQSSMVFWTSEAVFMLLVFRFIVIIIVISGPEASTPMPYSSIYKKCTITIFFSIFSRTLIQTRLFAFWHFSFSGFLTHNYLFNMATYMVDTLRQKKKQIEEPGQKKPWKVRLFPNFFVPFPSSFLIIV